MTVKVIGAGLAGSEAAYYLAERGIKVELYDIKPDSFTPCHINKDYGELVCSNSLKSNDVFGNACGTLKEEMRILGSTLLAIADECRVSAGNALAVDREKFAAKITEKIKNHANITCICKEVTEFSDDFPTIIATGPLTTTKLAEKISLLSGGNMFFYDAAAPIISADSIDLNHCFAGDRYGKGNGDYLNCPLTKEEYDAFIDELNNAERAKLHDFEKKEIFDGCMPVEIMASRGRETLRYGPLKSAGLTDPKTDRWPYACLQLRKENSDGNAYNLVGFQTNLKFSEQKRVFGMIPALRNADYLRYGVMHRNTYLNAPEILNEDFSVKGKPLLFFAGQITGVEGYVESMASGLMCALHLYRKLKGYKPIKFGRQTVLGSLSLYISTKNENFQPMNANYGILEDLGYAIRDKKLKKQKLSERAIEKIKAIKEEL